MKKKFGLIKIMIVALTAALLCACFKPDAHVETLVEVVEETVVEEPAPAVEEPEEVEPVEVKEEPQFILYNEDGSFYEPMHVTLEDFYAKVDDAEKEYFQAKEGKESSYKVWQRDRYVALLLAYNSPYMNEEDVVTVYDDYLSNFGWNAVSNAYSGLGEKVFVMGKKEPYLFGEYFIDPKLSYDVDLMDEYSKENGSAALLTLMSERVENIEKNNYIYNSFTWDLYQIYLETDDFNANKSLEEIFLDCPDDYVPGLTFSTYIVNAGRNEDKKYEVSKYVSSHQK